MKHFAQSFRLAFLSDTVQTGWWLTLSWQEALHGTV